MIPFRSVEISMIPFRSIEISVIPILHWIHSSSIPFHSAELAVIPFHSIEISVIPILHWIRSSSIPFHSAELAVILPLETTDYPAQNSPDPSLISRSTFKPLPTLTSSSFSAIVTFKCSYSFRISLALDMIAFAFSSLALYC